MGKSGISRRGFLTGVGAGVGALALAPAEAIAAVVTQQAGGLATSPDHFGRIFNLAPFADFNASGLRPALTALGAPGGIMDAKDPLSEGPVRLITNPELSPGNLDNPTHTAGTHFLGQFVDHDITFDRSSPLGVPTEPTTSLNSRTPGLDLDSVYGRGPALDPQFYNPADTAKLAIGSNGRFEDLPRDSNLKAIIPEPRNDENLMIAGLHCAMILFHNAVVDRLRSQGVTTNVFAQAQQLVRWHYQWIVLNELLPLFVSQAVVDDILVNGRKVYNPAPGQQFMPVEFQGACYRMGHSMVRPSYRANLAGNPDGTPFFGFIFDPAGQGQADPVDLRGGARAPRRFIGWQTFFDFGDGAVRPNKRIDTHISTPLFNLPLAAIASGDPPTALPQRNLLRQITWSMPSGQSVAQALGIQPLWAQNFPELQQFGFGMPSSTPLWYYILREADVLAGGLHLAGVGARIVGEVIIGLLQLDATSFLRTNPMWRPTLPRRNGAPTGDFRMIDLLTFAKVDPTSRGQ